MCLLNNGHPSALFDRDVQKACRFQTDELSWG